MKVSDVRDCAFASWYKNFCDITIPSFMVDLDAESVNYLKDSGTVVLPDYNCKEEQGGNESDDEFTLTAPSLDELSKLIENVITIFCAVFPKLNWSSPKDAAWITLDKTLRCFSPSDIYLLLKSSSFISHDLNSPYKNCEDKESVAEDIKYYLVLRKWVEINPSDEFRCFVKNKRLIAISQRDSSQYYSTIETSQKEIVSDICKFWKIHISRKFLLPSYVFDIHRPRADEITLIDFNPFGLTTDSLLFTWEELHDLADPQEGNKDDVSETSKEDSHLPSNPEFRFVSVDVGIQPNPLMQYGLPFDILNIHDDSHPGAITDLLKVKMENEHHESSSYADDNL